MPQMKRITDTPEAARKGIKTVKGQPVFYGEKKKRVNFTLTPTALEELEKFAQALNLSVSEFIERIGRGIIPVLVNDAGVQEPDSVESLAQQVAERLQATRPLTVWGASGEEKCRFLHQTLLDREHISVVTFPSSDDKSCFEELVRKMTEVLAVDTSHYEPVTKYDLDSDDTLTTKAGKADQQTQNLSATSEHNLLTTRQAWEIAKARGYTKSRDAFRAWSRRLPEKCCECHGLTVLIDPQQGKVIGYQDDQANETLEK